MLGDSMKEMMDKKTMMRRGGGGSRGGKSSSRSSRSTRVGEDSEESDSDDERMDDDGMVGMCISTDLCDNGFECGAMKLIPALTTAVIILAQL